mmetsp:Transcript_24651/g.61964  ORF Transcript_24651/g.61964 Transcript_24651/m.61964 type:complete len:351 (+) Transcript_24651:421-1473(+)
MAAKPVHEALGLGVFLPAVLFTTHIFFWTYLYEIRPLLVYTFTAFSLLVCAFLRSLKAESLLRKDVLLEQEGGPSLLPFQSAVRNRIWSFWNIVVVFAGIWIGRTNFQQNRLPFLLTRDGGIYYNVMPVDKTEDKTDAGIVYFNSKATTLDVNVFRGYRHKGTNYCVAPLRTVPEGAGTEHLVARYFAVGIDCCSESFAACLSHSSEDALTAENVNDANLGRGGVVVPALHFPRTADSPFFAGSDSVAFAYHRRSPEENLAEEMSVPFDGQPWSQSVFFQRAAKACAGYFGLQLGDKPMFVYYTSDPSSYQKSREGMIFGACVLSLGIGLPLILLGGVVITNVLSRRNRS